MTKTLLELKADVETAVTEANKAILTDSFKAIGGAKKTVNDVLGLYNAAVQEEEFSRLYATEDPMLEAIKKLELPTLSVGFKPDKDTGIEQGSVRDSSSIINLISFEDNSEVPVVPNGQWRYMTEKFAYLMTLRANADIGNNNVDVKSKWKYIDTKSRDVDLGATPTSTTQMTIQLQKIVDAILFMDNGKGENEYKVLKKDVQYILYTMCGRGKKPLSVSMPKRDTMVVLITQVLHRLVMGLSYTAEYDIAKK
ncbi:MAG: hypothetical protein RR365_01105 [Bacteroides sp.]